MSLYLPTTMTYAGPYDPSGGLAAGQLVMFGGATFIAKVPIAHAHRYAEDTFTGRSVQNGWGTASDGHSKWTVPEINNQSRLQNFSVKNGLGLLTYPSSGILLNDGEGGGFYVMFGAVQSGADRDLLVRFRYTQAMAAGWLTEWTLNSDSGWNTAAPDAGINITSTDLYVYNGGSDNSTGVARDVDLVPGTWYDLRLRCASPLFACRTWPTGTAEPETWDASVSDAFTVTPGQALFDPRWDMGVPNMQIQHRYVAELSINPTPDNDPSRFDQIA